MQKLWALACAGIVTGCGTYLPSLPSDHTVPLDALIANIQCEFETAAAVEMGRNPKHFLTQWQAAYTITLKGNETGSLKSTTNTFPWVPSKTLTVNFGLGAGGTTTANRTAVFKYGTDFAHVATHGPTCHPLPSDTLHPFFTGRIGFAEWMHRVLASGTRPSSMGHTFEFSIDVNANAGAGLIIGPAPTIGVNPAATIDRLEDGIVDVALAPIAHDKTVEALQELTKAERDLIAKLSQQRADKVAALDTSRDFLRSALVVDSITKIPDLDKLNPGAALEFNKNLLKEREVPDDLPLRIANANKTVASAPADIKTLDGAIDAILARPKVRIASKRLPAEQNGNIIAIQNQLTFERLNNALRIPAP